MSLRHHARAGMTLAAAYAVALQAILLATAVPVAGAAGVGTIPICANAAGHSVPASSGQDCLDACLTGCGGAVPVCPAPPAAAIYAPAVEQTMAPALDAGPRFTARASNAHRSRAPPVA
jgi:hypothetical protein